MDLSNINRSNTEELEAFFREHLTDSDFINVLSSNYNYLSTDFLREIRPQFNKVIEKMDMSEEWYFKHTRTINFYIEMFGKKD